MLRITSRMSQRLDRIAVLGFAMLFVLCATSCTRSDDGSSTATPASNNTQVKDDSASSTTTDKQSLQSAVKRLWDARVAQDWLVVYDYQQFRNAVNTTPAEFAKWSQENEPFLIKSYEIADTAVEGDFGWAKVNYVTSVRKFPDLPPTHTTREEKWQRVDGAWKLVPPAELADYPENPHSRDLEAEKVLRQRFEQSWKARVDRDWHALYEMIDPSARTQFAEKDYAEAKDTTIYISYDIKWINVTGDIGRVRVAVNHKINDPNLTKLPPSEIVVEETWVKRDGQWYMDPEKGGF